MVRESIYGSDRSAGDPFGDEHSARPSSNGLTPGPDSNFGERRQSGDSDWTLNGPKRPWTQADDFSRPSSMSTQAGSVVDIGSATRVNVGLSSAYNSPLTAGFPRSPYRTTIGRLVTPPMTTSTTGLQEQQQMALAHAQAQAKAQGLGVQRRVSEASSVMSTSTRAYSILEGFPIVPPSPISNLPMRSPPVSPLGQQSFSPKVSPKDTPRPEPPQDDLPTPPSRHTLGLSSGSHLSTSSNGLGSFTFHIDADGTQEVPPPPPAAFKGRQRASLDTLALTSDLSSYPLAFDPESRDSFGVSRKDGDGLSG